MSAAILTARNARCSDIVLVGHRASVAATRAVSGRSLIPLALVISESGSPEAKMDLQSLIFGTDPLALIALGGFVTVLIVTLALFIFMLKKLPSRR